MNNRQDMTRILKRVALITGIVTLAISIFFSYDGFDQSVSGANEGYSTLGKVIGVILAIIVCVVQFVFSTSYSGLNPTLKFMGLGAYVYSIYTNFVGVSHILGMSDFMAGATAFFMDVFPEPAIAWAMGEALTGDFIGNLGKVVFGEKETPKYASQTPQEKHRVSDGKLASPIFNPGYTDRYKQEKLRKIK